MVDTLKPRCYTLNIAKALQNKTVAPFLLAVSQRAWPDKNSVRVCGKQFNCYTLRMRCNGASKDETIVSHIFLHR